MASPINNNKGHMDRPNNTHNKATPMENNHTHDTYHNKAHMDNCTPLPHLSHLDSSNSHLDSSKSLLD